MNLTNTDPNETFVLINLIAFFYSRIFPLSEVFPKFFLVIIFLLFYNDMI